MNALRTPLVFIHGLWLHASSWNPWIELFRASGYEPIAPGYPGEPANISDARSNPEAVADRGIKDVFDHYSKIIGTLPSAPILIGHSFGGLLTEKLMGEGLGLAGVAIDPGQIKGVLAIPLAQLRTGLPVLRNPFNKNKAISLTKEQFRYGFGNALPREESDELFEKWAIPSPVRGVFEVAFANLTHNGASSVNTKNSNRGPLLLISGTADHSAPDVNTRAAFKMYRDSGAVTELKQFAGRGHSLTVDHGWSDVALTILNWLQAQKLSEVN
jgi:pimeloyl-ACP methyl ester carboxylesterase